MWLNALFLFQKFYFSGVIATSCGKNEDIRLFYACAW